MEKFIGNIKGAKGDKGDKGDTGAAGADGKSVLGFRYDAETGDLFVEIEDYGGH
jgi:hypothetical protein